MIVNRLLFYIIILLFFATCARQTSPTGGPQDTIPPKLISSNPNHRSLNVKDKKVELTFSELIILNNPKEQLIITPSPGKDFDVIAKKDKVIIDFEKDFADSTTYTFNFRDAVQDITEKNAAKNLLIAFSTGSYLDSLSIEGKVIDLLKGTELKEITVAIHPKNDTFSILKHPATYSTKTNDKGNFKLDYLRPDTYTLYAIDDKNRNLFADTRTEAYGFISTPIVLKSDTSKLQIAIIKLDARPLKLTSARPYNTYFNIKAAKNLKDFTLTTTDSATLYYNYGEDKSTIKLYNNFQNKDSVAIQLNALDSIGNSMDTLLYAKFPTRDVEKEKFSATITENRLVAENATLHAVITFNKPIKTTNFDSLIFKRDSLTILPINPSEISWNKFKTIATITKTFDKHWFQTAEPTQSSSSRPSPPKQQEKPDTTTTTLPILNELQAKPATFISIENDSSKNITQKINPLKVEDLSMFLFDVKTKEKNIIVQLIDKDYKVIQEKYNVFKGEFKDVDPGDYSIRVILDFNANKSWDPGNYLLKIEPEPVYYFLTEDKKQSVNIKANWEFDLPPLLITR